MLINMCCKRRPHVAWCTLLIVGLVVDNKCFGVEFGKIFKRRQMSSKHIQRTLNDVEANADEARKYHTACDQELARSLVILGEQKQQSEAALDSCKLQREKARDNVEFLTKKVDIINESLEEVDERCDRKVKESQSIANEKIEQLEGELEITRTEHAEEIDKLSLAHESETQELNNNQAEEIAKLNQANDEKGEILRKEKEEIISAYEKERQEAKLKFETTVKQHNKAIQDVEDRWQSKVANTEDELSKKLVRVESGLKIEVESVSKKLSTCDNSLSDTSKAKETLEGKYERALKKIGVLENVTAYSLAVEEAQDFARKVQEIAYKLLEPPYQVYFKDKVDRVSEVVEQAKPKLAPVTKPATEQYEKGTAALSTCASNEFSRMKLFFVNDVCSQMAQVERWEKEKGIDPAHISEAFGKACAEPTEFLEFVGWISLLLLFFTLRRLILRACFALCLLPFVIVILPFKLLFNSSPGRSKSPAGK